MFFCRGKRRVPARVWCNSISSTYIPPLDDVMESCYGYMSCVERPRRILLGKAERMAEDFYSGVDESLHEREILPARVHASQRLSAAGAQEHPEALGEVDAQAIEVDDLALAISHDAPERELGRVHGIRDSLAAELWVETTEFDLGVLAMEDGQLGDELVERHVASRHDLEHLEDAVERVVAERELAEAELVRGGFVVEVRVELPGGPTRVGLANTAVLDACSDSFAELRGQRAGSNGRHADIVSAEHPLREDAGDHVAVERELGRRDHEHAVTITVEREAGVEGRHLRCGQYDRRAAVLGDALALSLRHLARFHEETDDFDSELREEPACNRTRGPIACVEHDPEAGATDDIRIHLLAQVVDVSFLHHTFISEATATALDRPAAHDSIEVGEALLDEVGRFARAVGAVRVHGDDPDAVVLHVRAGDEDATVVTERLHGVGEEPGRDHAEVDHANTDMLESGDDLVRELGRALALVVAHYHGRVSAPSGS